MRKYILIFILISTKALFCQGLQMDWSNGFYDESARSEGHIVQVDDLNNVYVLGFSSGNTDYLDINPDPDVINQLESEGIFIAKFTSTGEYVWSVSLGETSSSSINLHGDIVINENGDVLVAATLKGDVDFDPTSGEMIVSEPDGMLALASYSSNGTLNFVKTIPLSAQGIIGMHGIDIDSDNNIFLGGFILNNGAINVEMDFNSGNTNGILTNESGNTFFLAKFTSSGNFESLKTISGTSSSSSNRLTDLAINAQNEVCITGEISGEWDLDPSEVFYPLSAGNRDVFIAKYSNDLNLIFAKVVLGPGTEFSREIALDAFDNMYLSGEFTGTVDFDPGEEEVFLNSPSGREPFILKFSPDGDLIFALELDSDSTSSSTNATRAISTDKLGYFYIAGKFERSCDFDPSENEFILSPLNEQELYLAKYDEQGNFIWAIAYGSSTLSFNLDLAINSNGVVTTCGIFRNESDFDPGIENTNTLGNTLNTMFLARYKPCHYSNTTASTCENEPFQASTRILTESGIYQVSYLSASGCDSIVTIDLNVNDLPNNGVFMDGDLAFVCEQSDAEYQWFDCENNEAISGATNQSFLPSGAGIYSVEIILNGCSVMSDCMSTEIVTNNEIQDNYIEVYPNPSNSIIHVNCKIGNEIKLFNMQGQLLHSQPAISENTVIGCLPKPGVYLVMIVNSKTEFKTKKLIIQ